MDRSHRRRQFLATTVGVSISGVAGCSELTEDYVNESVTEGEGSSDLQIEETAISSTRVHALNPVTIRVTVRNSGEEAGEMTIPLVVDGEIYQQRPVAVDPADERVVEFAFRGPVGTYEVGIESADTTVEVTEPERSLPVFREPAESLAITTGNDGRDRLLATTLQGVVNATRPQIVVADDANWVHTLGYSRERYEFWDLIETFSDWVSGAVVYDPSRSHTINAATTVAGVERGVVAAPSHLDRLESIGISPIVDFREESFETTRSMYRWTIEEYWERTADHVIVGLPPTAGGRDPHWQFRDYAVAVKAPCVWLDPERDNDVAVLRDLFNRTPTPAAYLGWWTDEVSGVTTASEHGVVTGAADFLESASVWSGTRPDEISALSASQSTEEIPELENVVYVTVTISEGDNLQYCQNKMKDNWDQFARGEVPINWSISPLLADIAPGILRHYVETATRNDHLMCGPTGLGYVYPKDWPDEDLERLTTGTGRYLEPLGIDTLYALNRLGIDSSMSDETVEAFERDAGITGIALGWDGPNLSHRGEETVVVDGIGGIAGGASISDVQAEIEDSVPDGWEGEEPVFRSVGVFGFEMGPRDIASLDRRLGSAFELVRGNVFFELARQAKRT